MTSSNHATDNSGSFKFKQKLISVKGNNGTKDIEIVV